MSKYIKLVSLGVVGLIMVGCGTESDNSVIQVPAGATVAISNSGEGDVTYITDNEDSNLSVIKITTTTTETTNTETNEGDKLDYDDAEVHEDSANPYCNLSEGSQEELSDEYCTRGMSDEECFEEVCDILDSEGSDDAEVPESANPYCILSEGSQEELEVEYCVDDMSEDECFEEVCTKI